MSRNIVVDPGAGYVHADDFRERRPDVKVRESEDVMAALSETDGPTALISSNRTWKDAYLKELSPGDWVTTIGAGHENFSLIKISKKGAVFTNFPGISSEQIAEHVFAMALSFTRRLWTHREEENADDWVRAAGSKRHRWMMTDLVGDTCCVLGLGGVGEAVAVRANAFGMSVRGVKRKVEEYDGSAKEVYGPDDILEALSGARLLVVAVPLTDETRGMIGLEELNVLADDAIVVNVARGPILVTDDLVKSLNNGTISAACLDVTQPEPLPEDHPLWNRNNVLITPHCAGLSDKYPERYLDRFFDQYQRWCEDDELLHRVV